MADGLVFDDLIFANYGYRADDGRGSLFVNRAFWRVNQTGTPAGELDTTKAANTLFHHFQLRVATVISNKVTLTNCNIFAGLNGVPITKIAISTLPEQAGFDSDVPLPFQNAASFRIRSSFPGRHGRGRVYVPGLVQRQVVGSFLDPTEAASLEGAFQQCWTTTLTTDEDGTILPDGFQLVPCRSTLVHPSGSQVIMTYRADVSSGSLDSVVRSQRRRQPDRGS